MCGSQLSSYLKAMAVITEEVSVACCTPAVHPVPTRRLTRWSVCSTGLGIWLRSPCCIAFSCREIRCDTQYFTQKVAHGECLTNAAVTVSAELEMELLALPELGKCSATELYPSSYYFSLRQSLAQLLGWLEFDSFSGSPVAEITGMNHWT